MIGLLSSAQGWCLGWPMISISQPIKKVLTWPK